jgi:TPR repeat protein
VADRSRSAKIGEVTKFDEPALTALRDGCLTCEEAIGMAVRVLVALAVSMMALAGGVVSAKPRPSPATVVVVEPDGHVHRVPSKDGHCTTCDGVALLAAGQYARAMHVFTLRAAEGDGAAMADLGSMYDQGLGVPRNEAVALKWYSKAAEAGDGDGLAFVGYAYQHATPSDYRRAILYYRQAVDAGSALAMNQMGYLYEHGLGVGADVKLAYCWYQFAAANGHPRAREHVAELEASGQAVTPDDAATCQALNHPDVPAG